MQPDITSQASEGTCLQDDLFWSLICLQEVADIQEGVVLVAGLLPFQVVPAKFDELLAVGGHAAWQVAHQQRRQLKELHVDCI